MVAILGKSRSFPLISVHLSRAQGRLWRRMGVEWAGFGGDVDGFGGQLGGFGGTGEIYMDERDGLGDLDG